MGGLRQAAGGDRGGFGAGRMGSTLIHDVELEVLRCFVRMPKRGVSRDIVGSSFCEIEGPRRDWGRQSQDEGSQDGKDEES